jgi:hypothetical protein
MIGFVRECSDLFGIFGNNHLESPPPPPVSIVVVAFVAVSVTQDVASGITSVTSVTPTAILASAAAIATAMMSLSSFCQSHFGEHSFQRASILIYILV